MSIYGAEQLLVLLIICSMFVEILEVGAIMAIIGDNSNLPDRQLWLAVYIVFSKHVLGLSI